MGMNKEVLLVVDFKKAPVELQSATTAHAEAVKVVKKARNDLAAAQKKLDDAIAISQGTENQFNKLFTAWNPEV